MEVPPHECDLVRARNFPPLYSWPRKRQLNQIELSQIACEEVLRLTPEKERVVLRGHPICLPITLDQGQAL